MNFEEFVDFIKKFNAKEFLVTLKLKADQLKELLSKLDAEDISQIIDISKLDDYIVWVLKKLNLIKIIEFGTRKYGKLVAWFEKAIKTIGPLDLEDLYKAIIAPKLKKLSKFWYKIEKWFKNIF